MRILQIITLSELGGAQSVVVNLANYLSRNHEVIVAAGEGDGKMYSLLNTDIKTEKIPSLQRAISPIKELRAIREMQLLRKKYNPDVIHLHSSKAGILGRIAFPRNKTVYTVHGFDSIRVAYRKFLPLEKLLQHRCNAIVGVSRYDEKNLLSEGIVRNVSAIYNGIYPPEKLETEPFARYRAKYMKIILCIARLAPPKRLDLYVELATRFPDYAFLWIGNIGLPVCDYPSNLYFLGNIPGAASYIRYADLFVLPSDYEGLPMVIIEALASGVPVVASAVGGITELLDGKNGFAVDNDVDAMGAKIQKIFNLGTHDAKSMSDAAVYSFRKNFTIEQMGDRYLDIYKSLVE